MSEKIALTVIAGDDALDEGFERMLKSVAGKVDGIFVVFTGKEKDVYDILLDIVKTETALVAPVPWQKDFSLARNASFALVEHFEEQSGEKFDFIFWLDCDDVLPEYVDLQTACFEMRSRRAHAALMDYHYKIDVERDVVLMSHYKERLFRADVAWEWIYPIHENCVGPMGTRTIKLTGSDFHVRHLRSNEDAKRARNQELISQWFQREGDREPRAVMFMGHQTTSLAEDSQNETDKVALYKAALRFYRQFIAMSPANEDAYICNRQVAEILRTLGRFGDALNIDLQGIKAEPTWPSCYVGIAETHFQAGGFEDAIEWCDIALGLWFDESLIPIHDRLEAKYRPLMIKGAALMELGRPDEALAQFKFAQTYYDDEFIRERIDDVSKLMLSDDVDVIDASLIHDRNWGARPERSIAFFVPPSIEDWNPDALSEHGLGGTETCVIKLAEHMADLGWRVAIFGQPGSWEGYVRGSHNHPKGRVEWYRSGMFHPDEPFTVFVALRSPEILDASINAQMKILWLHDVSMGDVRYSTLGDRFSKVDAIVCPSFFHMRHIHRVYGAGNPWSASNNAIINGFDRDLFLSNGQARDPKRMVYASSPDRGLPRLLDLWPQIAERIDGASLHIFYGWDSINAIIERDLPTAPMLRWFKQQTEAKLDSLLAAGHAITWHGRVDQETLASEFKQSGVMPYPANFQETFGIVFAQALTAGVVPVVPDLGALPQMGCTVVPGSPDSMEYGPRFIDAVEQAVHVTHRDELPVLTTTMEWIKVAEGWEKLIASHFDGVIVEELVS